MRARQDRRRWSRSLLGLLLIACGGDGVVAPPEEPSPPSLTILSGNDQTGEFSVTLGEALTIRVTNARGDGVGNVLVTWRVVSGAGALSYYGAIPDREGMVTMLTPANGIAYTRLTPWVPGQIVVTAEVAGASEVATFRADIHDLEWPAPPASAVIYERSDYSPEMLGWHGVYSERLVVEDDGTFRMWSRSGRWGLFELAGVWSTGAPATIAFEFDVTSGVAGDWSAIGHDDGGCLDMTYSFAMWLEGYEDGRYCSPAGSP